MPPELSTDQLVAELRKLTSNMELLLAEGGSKVKEHLGDASSGLESRLHRAKSRLQDLEHNTRRKIKQTAGEVDRYAHENPWQLGGASIVTGVVLGIVIGLALASRRE